MNRRTSREAVVSIAWQVSMNASRKSSSILTTNFTPSPFLGFCFLLLPIG
jgi:hypothetical protein